MNYLENMPNELRFRSEAVAIEVRAELARQEKTINQVADYVGMPVSTMRRSVKGQRPFTIDELGAISEFLGIGIVQLLKRSDRAPGTAA
ncbi:helix-turn-helix transcriptional regulator [Corynebacterium sp. SCR221107]|uniref:helix-turn-helix domain-containing protein n=1 Tax=Corynebacterium sp. SCR221107 TaxID=3017361 RepID=UPI0022EC206F|nr:helix-turn-helix transcriptional regulator [Corynebacterium sp. SCR221107]WBT08819.1 helix-turn-helix transcriptional regulator [Corynebacterium sp. SCR221107]